MIDLGGNKFFREYWETFDDFHVEIEEVINAEEDQADQDCCARRRARARER